MTTELTALLDSADATLWDIQTAGDGPPGALPITKEMLLDLPSGDLFGLTQNAGMGWRPDQLLRKQVLILSTQGGIRGEDGPHSVVQNPVGALVKKSTVFAMVQCATPHTRVPTGAHRKDFWD